MPVLDITLLRATPEDVAELLLLSRQTFTEAFGPLNTAANMAAYMDQAFTEGQLLNELRDEASTFFLAFAEDDTQGQPVGYAKLREGSGQPALAGFRALEIQRIYVLARVKGHGVGKLLMQTCLDTARQRDVEVVWLGVWEHNPAAIAFYQRWGFEQFGSYIFPFGDEDQTDWLMCKWL